MSAMMTYVLEAAKIHGDDTPVRMLGPGGGTIQAHFWVYLRDNRASGDLSAAAVIYFFSINRRGEHPARHLKGFEGYFQADAYSGYNDLYRDPDTKAPRAILEVGCWSHVRRKFNDILESEKGCSPIAAQAIIRIGELFAIERRIKGEPPGMRRQVRQDEALPKLIALRAWFETQLRGLAPGSKLAKACHYALNRWEVMTRYCEDGILEISNNLVENALRGVTVGRRNWLFVGSRKGGEHAAVFYSLIETCRLNGIDPEAYLSDVIERIGDHPINRISELLPWQWQAARQAQLLDQAA